MLQTEETFFYELIGTHNDKCTVLLLRFYSVLIYV